MSLRQNKATARPVALPNLPTARNGAPSAWTQRRIIDGGNQSARKRTSQRALLRNDSRMTATRVAAAGAGVAVTAVALPFEVRGERRDCLMCGVVESSGGTKR